MNSFWQANKLSIATLVALTLGIGGGMLMRGFGDWSQVSLGLIALPGDIHKNVKDGGAPIDLPQADPGGHLSGREA